MSRYAITPNLLANGNIAPASFVKIDPSNPLQALQAGVGDTPIGISGPGTDTAPGTTGATSNEAVAGEGPLIYGPGSIVELTAGSAGWTQGNLLKPDTNGNGTPITNVYDVAGAIALDSANAGELSRVMVLPPTQNMSAETVQAVTASTAWTAQDSSKVIMVNGADTVQTLPTAAAGLMYTFINTPTGAGGATGTTVAVQAADKMHGNGFTAAAGKGAVNTHASAADGDALVVIGNGIDGWNILNVRGTWARVA